MLDNAGGPDRYLAITPSQERFSDLWGLLPHGSFARLRYLLAHSPQFRIVYSNGQAEIYKVSEVKTSSARPVPDSRHSDLKHDAHFIPGHAGERAHWALPNGSWVRRPGTAPPS